MPADPLFAAAPERLRVLHGHGDTMDLPPDATLLASCDRYPVQAFRIGGSAWGLQFHLEVDKDAVDAFVTAFPDEAATAPDLPDSTPAELAALAPHRDGVFERFAAHVASHAARTTTRAVFTSRAATWEEHFAADGPRYAAAVTRMELLPGSGSWTWAAALASPCPPCAPESAPRSPCSAWTSPRQCSRLPPEKDVPASPISSWPTPADCPCRPDRWTASSART
ncbi:type 1 glutamine amidotransferase [Streptomyces sp. BRA346]|uniref:type 1 glutamine amidotransferase n=1 Tax=Streptomyces sp. BRA346 TaxID=2878199 RepID=UPI0040635228